MSNCYTDATGILRFREGTTPSAIVRALFEPFAFQYPHDDATPNGAYIADKAELSNTTWEAITGKLAELVEELSLISEDEDSDDLSLSELVPRLATHYGVDASRFTEYLDQAELDQPADIEAVFDLALLLDAGQGLDSITWEGAHHSDRALIAGFGGFGFHGSQHVRVWDNSQRPLTLGEKLDKAIEAKDLAKASDVLIKEVERLLDGIVDDWNRYAIRQALIDTLLGKAAHAEAGEATNTEPPVDLGAVAEWVGLHYGRNFDAESPEQRKDWIQRYIEAHRQADDA